MQARPGLDGARRAQICVGRAPPARATALLRRQRRRHCPEFASVARARPVTRAGDGGGEEEERRERSLGGGENARWEEWGGATGRPRGRRGRGGYCRDNYH